MNANKFSRDAAAVMMKNVNHEKLNVLGNLFLSLSLSLCVSDALGESNMCDVSL